MSFHRVCIWIAVLCLAHLPSSLCAEGRGGLGRTWDKLAREKQITIAYFGGSLTAGAGASDPDKTSWRAKTTGWFREQFPSAHIAEVNAGVGGTGSDLGAFRCGRDILAAAPDLVFIDFAVNDYGSPPSRLAYYEGIIRQILQKNPEADIVLVYMVMKASDSYGKGTIPVEVERQQRLADHYGLASVNPGQALSQAIRDGHGTWETYTKDGTHPNDEGYRIYTEAMQAFLAMHREDHAFPAPPLPSPLHADPVEHAGLVDSWTVNAPGWTKEDKSLANRFPHRIAATVPKTELNFTFKGTGVGLYWLVAPDSGAIEYSIDGGPVKLASSWDATALQFTRAHYVILADDLQIGEHTLNLKIASSPPGRSAGTAIRIGAFLVKQ